jgi:hypothetical protein
MAGEECARPLSREQLDPAGSRQIRSDVNLQGRLWVSMARLEIRNLRRSSVHCIFNRKPNVEHQKFLISNYSHIFMHVQLTKKSEQRNAETTSKDKICY